MDWLISRMHSLSRSGKNSTEWKFQDFSVIQILCEINFSKVWRKLVILAFRLTFAPCVEALLIMYLIEETKQSLIFHLQTIKSK